MNYSLHSLIDTPVSARKRWADPVGEPPRPCGRGTAVPTDSADTEKGVTSLRKRLATFGNFQEIEKELANSPNVLNSLVTAIGVGTTETGASEVYSSLVYIPTHSPATRTLSSRRNRVLLEARLQRRREETRRGLGGSYPTYRSRIFKRWRPDYL